jgi:hypothetical protein
MKTVEMINNVLEINIPEMYSVFIEVNRDKNAKFQGKMKYMTKSSSKMDKVERKHESAQICSHFVQFP